MTFDLIMNMIFIFSNLTSFILLTHVYKVLVEMFAHLFFLRTLYAHGTLSSFMFWFIIQEGIYGIFAFLTLELWRNKIIDWLHGNFWIIIYWVIKDCLIFWTFHHCALSSEMRSCKTSKYIWFFNFLGLDLPCWTIIAINNLCLFHGFFVNCKNPFAQ